MPTWVAGFIGTEPQKSQVRHNVLHAIEPNGQDERIVTLKRDPADPVFDNYAETDHEPIVLVYAPPGSAVSAHDELVEITTPPPGGEAEGWEGEDMPDLSQEILLGKLGGVQTRKIAQRLDSGEGLTAYADFQDPNPERGDYRQPQVVAYW